MREALELRPEWVTVNPVRTWRSRENVTAFRNLVVEHDVGTLDQQLDYMLASGFPITTAVFSGNKSIHFVCALSEPLADINEHYEVRRWLDIIFKSGDKAVKDPARFTRAPDALNSKTGAKQELLVCEKRVNKERLVAFLAKHAELVEAHDERERRRLAEIEAKRERGERIEFSPSQRAFLTGEQQAAPGTRHRRLYAIMCVACDEVGLSYDEAQELAFNAALAQGYTHDRMSEVEKLVFDVYFKRRS